MKKIVFSIVFLSGLSFATLAQQNSHQGGGQGGQHQGGGQGGQHQGGGQGGQKMTAEQKATKLTQYMTTNLNLTSDQQAKVLALNTSKAKQLDSIHAQNKGNMEAVKTAAKPIRDSYNTSLNAILTADQKTKWEELKKQKKAEFEKNRAAGTKPAEGDLTPEDVQ
jgi:protein CpxP